MAWLLAIFFLPYLGILLFLLFGRARLPKARRRRGSARSTSTSSRRPRASTGCEVDPPLPAWLEPDRRAQPHSSARCRSSAATAPGCGPTTSSRSTRWSRRSRARRRTRALRVLHPVARRRDAHRSSTRSRRRRPRGPGARAARSPRQLPVPRLQAHHEAPQRDGRRVAPDAAGAAVQAASSSDPTCATTASCSWSTARSPSPVRTTSSSPRTSAGRTIDAGTRSGRTTGCGSRARSSPASTRSS